MKRPATFPRFWVRSTGIGWKPVVVKVDEGGPIVLRNKGTMLVGLAALLGVLLLAGCPQDGGGGGGDGDGGQELDITRLTSEWAESSHTAIVTSAAEEPFCVQCHDGGAFAQGVTDPAELDREWPVSTDCRACHTGQGNDLIESGEASAPVLTEALELGPAAVCSGCHRSFARPDIGDEERETPHHSPIIDIYSGEGGIRTGGMEVGSSEGHMDVEGTCAGCHMADSEGQPGHTFRVEDAQAVCGECHEDFESTDGTLTLQAQADYDGEGGAQPFQAEVQGLLDRLDQAITDAADGASYSVERGDIVFRRGETTVTPEITDELYLAVYNHYLISEDSWMGAHNPRFTVDLLQGSYEVLAGEPIPNAQPYGEEDGGGSEETTGGGSGETTGQETTPGG